MAIIGFSFGGTRGNTVEDTRSVYQGNYDHPHADQYGRDTYPEVVHRLGGPSSDPNSPLSWAWFRLCDEAQVTAESLAFPDFLNGENLLPKMFRFKNGTGMYADVSYPPKELSGKWGEVRKNLSWSRITKLLPRLGYPPKMIRDQEQHERFIGFLLVRVTRNCWDCEPTAITELARIAVHRRNRQIREMRKDKKLTLVGKSAAA